MKKVRLTYKYLLHRLDAKNTRGHGIHSPYLYRFTQNAMYEKNPFYIFKKIEALQIELLQDERLLSFKDIVRGKNRELKVRQISKASLKHAKWGRLLYRIVHFTNAKTILELGTSLGLTTAYLTSPATDIRCVTFEESSQLAEIARGNFKKLGIDRNIDIIVGNIDETLAPQLAQMDTVDVVFIRANHRKASVLNYFSQCLKHIHSDSVLIIDDIHWSSEMEQAWNSIRKHEKVTASIDLFEMGIVFFFLIYPKKKFQMALGVV